MNEETPSPFDTVGDEPIEARIVAWVLGEASAFEAAELERLCEERPELLVFRRRMRALHGLLSDAEASEADHSWKLPPDKRKALDEIFGQEKVVRLDVGKEASIRRSGRRAMFAIAACFVLTIAVARLIFPKLGREEEVRDEKSVSFMEAASPPSPEEMKKLDKAVRDQEDKVEERRRVLSTIVRTKGVIYAGPDSFSGDDYLSEDHSSPNVPGDRSKLMRDKSQLESQLEILQKYDGERLMTYAAGLDVPDNMHKVFYPKYREAKQQLEEQKNAGIEENNPTFLAKKDEVEAMKHQLDDSIANISDTIRAKLNMANDSLKGIEDMKAFKREDARKRGLDAQDYVDAKRNFEKDQELLQQMRLKQIDLATRSKITTESFSGGGGPPAAAAPVPAAPVVGRADLAYQVESAPNARARKEGMLETARRNQISRSPSQPRADTAPAADAAAMEIAGSSSMAEHTLADGSSMKPQSALVAPQPGAGGGAGFSGGRVADADALVPSEPDDSISANGETDAFASPGISNGMRSGDQAINRNNIDAILNNPSRAKKGSDAEAAVAQAMQNRKVGKYDEARKLLQGALATDPGNEAAKRELDYLADPIRTNPALAVEQGTPTDKVRRALYVAEGHFNLGKYDEAKKSYEDVLRVDPDSKVAHRGMERVASAKSDYYRAAYDHTRAELLSQVDKAWELPVPPTPETVPPVLAKRGASDFPAGGDTLTETPNEKSPNNAELSGSLFSRWSSRQNQGQDHAAQQDLYRYGQSTNGPLGNDLASLFKGTSSPDADAMNVLGFARTPENSGYHEKVAGVEMQVKPSAFIEDADALTPAGQKQEQKAAPEPNLTELMEEISAAANPYSTFSLNVSDASFQIAKAALAKGERPDPAGVKVEQFYNAVDYGDPAPASNEPVAATIEQAAHPVIPGRTLVRVALRTGSAGRSAKQPLGLTLLVDQSGSMGREDRRMAMEQALGQLAGLLTKDDLVTVIGFSRTPRLLADGLTGDRVGKLSDLVNQIASEGGTNLEEAMKLAGQSALSRKLAGGQNRIVLFTDGAANLGNADPVRLAAQVKALRQSGIAIDIAGIGADDLNDRLLSELARNGNGRYYVVGKEKNDSFARQLAGAFRPAAENVKVQVNFNTQRVGQYKLIGFEKDRLKTEDFRNDTVDAAELAADEAGVAIYQVETLPGGSGEIGEVAVRFRDAASSEMVERSWTMSYDSAASPFDRATPSMQLAGLSMLAAEKLRGGPLADAIDFNQLAESSAFVKQFYGSSPRVADMLRVVDALK